MKKNAKRIKEKQITKKKGQIAKQIKTVLFVFTTRPTSFFWGYGPFIGTYFMRVRIDQMVPRSRRGGSIRLKIED